MGREDKNSEPKASGDRVTSILPKIQPGARIYSKDIPTAESRTITKDSVKRPSSYVQEAIDADREYDERAARRRQARAGKTQPKRSSSKKASSGRAVSEKTRRRSGKAFNNINPKLLIIVALIIIVIIIILVVKGCGGNKTVPVTGETQIGTEAVPEETYATITNAEEFIRNAFLTVLGRNAGDEFVVQWKDKLTTGADTAGKLAQSLLFSDEFIAKGVSNEDFLNTAYKLLLNKAPDVESFKKYSGWMESGVSRKAVLGGIVKSEGFAVYCAQLGMIPGEVIGDGPMDAKPEMAGLISRVISKALNRSSSESEIQSWVDSINSGSYSINDMILHVFSGSEFQGRNLSDEEFVKALYEAILGRTPGAEEITNAVQMIQGGKAREEMVSGFCNSQEFRDYCSANGIN